MVSLKAQETLQRMDHITGPTRFTYYGVVETVVRPITIKGRTLSQAFGTYFRDYVNRHKYCNHIRYEILSAVRQAQFLKWISNVRNYAGNGGDMW